MTTARDLLNTALREPMAANGWTPRAAGWFTRPLSPGCLAVVAAGVASKHAVVAGEGRAFAHVGLRLDAVEEMVASLCDIKDGGYRQRTAVVELGYVTPAGRWGEHPLSARTAEHVASALAADATQHGLPHLERLAGDGAALMTQVQGAGSVVDVARRVVLAAVTVGAEQASASLQQSLEELADRTDPAAVQTREVAQRLSSWLRDRR